jgi:hypothetical protein
VLYSYLTVTCKAAGTARRPPTLHLELQTCEFPTRPPFGPVTPDPSPAARPRCQDEKKTAVGPPPASCHLCSDIDGRQPFWPNVFHFRSVPHRPHVVSKHSCTHQRLVSGTPETTPAYPSHPTKYVTELSVSFPQNLGLTLKPTVWTQLLSASPSSKAPANWASCFVRDHAHQPGISILPAIRTHPRDVVRAVVRHQCVGLRVDTWWKATLLEGSVRLETGTPRECCGLLLSLQ